MTHTHSENLFVQNYGSLVYCNYEPYGMFIVCSWKVDNFDVKYLSASSHPDGNLKFPSSLYKQCISYPAVVYIPLPDQPLSQATLSHEMLHS